MKKTCKLLLAVFALTVVALFAMGTGSRAAGWNDGLRQTDAGESSVSLVWNAYIGTDIRYQVEVSADEKNFAPQDSYRPSSPKDTLTGLTPGLTYYVRVIAYSGQTEVAVSQTIRVSTEPSVGIVTGLVQTGATVNSISMKWNPVSGASSYDIYRYNSSSNYIKIGTTTGTSYTAAGLTASQEIAYFVIATAKTATGIMGQSSHYSKVYMHTVPSKVAMVAMTNYYNYTHVAYFKWTSVANAMGYQFQLLNYKGKKLLEKETSAYSNSTDVNPFARGVFTQARVRAFIKIGNQKLYGAWSDVTYNASAKKVTVKRTRNRKKITVKWKKISGASGYKVMISTKSDSGFKKVKTVGKKKSSVTITKCGKKKLKKKKTYYIRVLYLTKAGKKTVTSSIMGVGSI